MVNGQRAVRNDVSLDAIARNWKRLLGKEK
jgi:hypothetical protein